MFQFTEWSLNGRLGETAFCKNSIACNRCGKPSLSVFVVEISKWNSSALFLIALIVWQYIYDRQTRT